VEVSNCWANFVLVRIVIASVAHTAQLEHYQLKNKVYLEKTEDYCCIVYYTRKVYSVVFMYIYPKV
jgi:hypothetical protein